MTVVCCLPGDGIGPEVMEAARHVLRALPLEINRSLYMDERRYECTASFATLAADLELLADRLADIPVQELRPYRAAAE